MRTKLTTKFVDSLPPATAKRYEVRDVMVPGLHIRVSASGSKVWYLATRIDGRMRRIKAGPYPIVSLSDARERAQSILRDVALGQYVDRAQTVAEDSVLTLGEVIPQFIKLYARPRNRDWKGTERILRKFATLDGTAVDKLKRSEVVKVLDGIVASGTPIRANRALAAIKKLMSWCVDRGMIEVSPIAGLKAPSKEVSRERVLSDIELMSCWNASKAEGFPFDAFVQILMLTAQRRGEVAGMRWSEVDLAKEIWTIPAKRAKNGTTHAVPLVSKAIDILNSLPRFLNSDIVFTTTGLTEISGFGRLKRRLDEAVGRQAEEWRLHDIRRTAATNMAMIGVQPHIVEAVLNHRSGIVSGVAAIYNRHAYLEEKRAALEMWAGSLGEMIGRSSISSDDQGGPTPAWSMVSR